MPKQPFRVRVEPVQRSTIDTQKLARLIIELATEQTELQRLLNEVDGADKPAVAPHPGKALPHQLGDGDPIEGQAA